MDTTHRLSRLTLMLHWLVATAMIAMTILGFWLWFVESGTPERRLTMDLHKSIGTLVLVVAFARVVWRLRVGLPPAADMSASARQVRLAHAAHMALLAVTVAMPVSGLMRSIGGGYGLVVFGVPVVEKGPKYELVADIGAVVHQAAAYLLVVLVVLHVAAAIKHHVVDRDSTLDRMLGRSVAGGA
ncbi:Cytochrome b561 [Rhodoplanes serenus]|uniref:Cytochrome b561 n=1 Tax=Rhodoplanes serenus TaxID=200615 RepID=A0A3S4FCK2_9BRAD|nr:cytochrome b/b6 domain-containing protein [Rhodoplanes serenus]VCU11082.1 Cytochrome b561 [Rhodoplanes serenus]